MKPLPVTLAAGLEFALNRFIGLDPETQNRLAALAGKVIAIELRDLGLRFYLLPTDSGLLVQGHFEGEADTTLHGTSIALTRMGLRDEASDSLFSGDVQISGDVELGETFRAVLDGMDIDWEEQLSRLTGDVIAHQVGNVVRGVMQWGKKAADTLRQDVAEYVHEESRVLPPRSEVEGFNKAVDDIRMDIDRLEARVQRLQQRMVQSETKSQTKPAAKKSSTKKSSAISNNLKQRH